MTTFHLIRHGSTELVGKALSGRLPGVPLDATGRNQAQQLAVRLAELDIAAIYSSPLERAIQTAEPLAQRKATRIVIRERWNEIDVGQWQGRTLKSLADDAGFSRFNTLRSITPTPNGEYMLEIQVRVAKELNELRNMHSGQTVAVFSHGDVIKSAVMLCLGMPLDQHLRLEISPASVSVIEIAEWGPKVISVNS